MKKLDERRKGVEMGIPMLAVGFGLLAGLVEGIALLTLHQANLLTWRLQNRAIWYETLWIAPLVDVILFSLLGFGLTIAGLIFPRVPIRKISWPLFIFLTVFDWIFIFLYGRISLIALLALAVGLTVQLAYSTFRREPFLFNLVRRSVSWLAGSAVALFLIIQGGGWLNETMRTMRLQNAQSAAPNVLVIVVDALRADHLAAYGYSRDTSPFIDRLAEEGVLFENAISASSWTQPSHASMLTGHYTYDHQAELQPLDERFPTIGEVLQTQGYRTGAFSANTLFFTRRQGFGRGFLHFEDNNQSILDAFLNSSLYGFIFDYYGLRKALNYEGVPTRKYADDINRSVLDWVDQKPEIPFFVFLNYFDVHDPYLPPEPYRSKYASVEDPGGLINGFVERYHPDLTPEQLQSEIDAYDGSIAYVDDQIKSLLAELDQRGLLEDTIVIITADHGESLGEHGLLQHSASLYMQEIHVPLIIWGSDDLPSGKRIDVPVSTTSLPSTILSLIGAQNDQFPELSLTLLMVFGEVPVNWPNPISEVAQFEGAAEQNPTTYGEMKSVVDIEMQYIVHEKFGDELYNWRVDPEETNSLADDPSVVTVLDVFKSYLKELIGDPIFKNP